MAAYHTRTSHRLVFAALFSCLAGPALAQDVPLPAKKPSAANATGSNANPQRALPPTQAQTQVQAQAQAPASNPFAGLLGKSASGSLNPEQRGIIDKVNGYLTATQVLSGKFVQVGPDGRRTQGNFYISKPGKVRFE